MARPRKTRGMTLKNAPRCFLLLSVFLLACGFTRLDAGSPAGDSPFAGVLASPIHRSDATDRGLGNRVAMLSGGYDALLVRVHLIRSARRSIEMQTFIWTNDEVGRLLIWELLEAARRGVKVRIIADHMFSDQEPEIAAFVASAHPNLEVRHYRPAASRIKPAFWRTALSALRSFRAINQRMHSKVMIIDGAVLITGGRNVENTYFDHSTGLNFRDRDVLAVGPLVATAVEQFAEFWNYRHSIPSRELKDVSAVLEKGSFRRYDRREDYDFGGHFDALNAEADDASLMASRFVSKLRHVERAVFLYDSPGKSRRVAAHNAQITRELTAVLQRAKSRVVMQTPYLVLSPTARDLFLELRRRDPAVDIRVSTNSFASTDNLYAYSANYRLRNEYVQTLGLSVYEYKPHPADLHALFPRFSEMDALARQKKASSNRPCLCVHAKSLVVDDTIGFVGSFNLDPRSEHLNTEVGILVTDKDFAEALRAEIERDMLPENSWVIWRRRFPLKLEVVNGLVGGLLSLSPIEVWPIQNTTSYELLPGHAAVMPSDPTFFDHYREVGPFPGADGALSQKEILTRLFKAVGSPLTPIL